MSFLSGLTIGLFRETRDGRRVVGFGPAGFRKMWYLVADAAVPVVERRFRQYFVATSFVIIPAVVVLSGLNWWLLGAVVILSPLAMWYWVVRDLPRTTVAAEELFPVDRRAQDLAQSQATGERALWLLMVAAIVMGGLQLVVAIADGVWWAWFGAVMFSVAAAMMARQILMVRRARR